MATPVATAWEQHVDEGSGQTYWWNPITDESRWTEPPPPEAPSPAVSSPPAVKSFLDPTMAAGFPRTMRSENQRTPAQSAAAARDMSAFEDAEDDLYTDPPSTTQPRVPEPEPEPQPDPHPNESHSTTVNSDATEEVDRSLSYNELVEMKKAGKRPPGIKDIDDKPRGPPPPGFARSKSELTTLKPWERKRAEQMGTKTAGSQDR